MKINKNIDDLLTRRRKYAEKLEAVSTELDDWLENNGADLLDDDLRDSTITGCMIYAEPSNAEYNVREYIENKM